MSTDKHLRCSFCGKSKDSVKKFISGPSVYICNECVLLCNEILAEEEEREHAESAVPSPTPAEIKDALDEYVIGQEDAKRDQIENYESSNDAYVVEDYGCAALAESITLV